MMNDDPFFYLVLYSVQCTVYSIVLYGLLYCAQVAPLGKSSDVQYCTLYVGRYTVRKRRFF
jgi:hypothetical protein